MIASSMQPVAEIHSPAGRPSPLSSCIERPRMRALRPFSSWSTRVPAMRRYCSSNSSAHQSNRESQGQSLRSGQAENVDNCNSSRNSEQHLGRRASLVSLAGIAAASVTSSATQAFELSAQQEEARLSIPAADIDTTVTERVFVDIGLCPEMLNRARRIGDQSALCSEPAPLGRITIGLYGNHLPVTTANFKRAVCEGLYTGTIFHRILPGAFIQAGRQGSKRLGEVWVPKDTQAANPEVLQGRSYMLPHLRPGSVSLVLSQNDDYPDIKQGRDYRNAQFLITTGPGPVPALDEENIVFGRVLDGFGTINSISQVPTFMPGESARQMNAFATFLGDERAAKAKQKWGRPLKAVVITAGGILA